ncbi:10692_t:CDS:2 [Entrophospora sp. SA101]|nr:10692_t:CDS:2 [Entrophospora sp. SA101]
MKIKNQGDTKNAIKTTVKNLNNSDLNNSQQLATVKELLTNHQEKEPKEPISDSDSDDGYETADDEIWEEPETKEEKLTKNYQKLQSLYQQ